MSLTLTNFTNNLVGNTYTLSNLQPNTEYYFQVQITHDESGKSVTHVSHRSFRTLAEPPPFDIVDHRIVASVFYNTLSLTVDTIELSDSYYNDKDIELYYLLASVVYENNYPIADETITENTIPFKVSDLPLRIEHTGEWTTSYVFAYIVRYQGNDYVSFRFSDVQEVQSQPVFDFRATNSINIISPSSFTFNVDNFTTGDPFYNDVPFDVVLRYMHPNFDGDIATAHFWQNKNPGSLSTTLNAGVFWSSGDTVWLQLDFYRKDIGYVLVETYYYRVDTSDENASISNPPGAIHFFNRDAEYVDLVFDFVKGQVEDIPIVDQLNLLINGEVPVFENPITYIDYAEQHPVYGFYMKVAIPYISSVTKIDFKQGQNMLYSIFVPNF
jgi:hypothetical protein